MCGFVALLIGTSLPSGRALHAVRMAQQQMLRRGPDAEGQWSEPGVALGHRRLAIIDLDRRAAQPMASACGRYVIVFNGEIYNFRALRNDLEQKGHRFCTESDTEVILTLFATEGAAMLPKLNGMFAFLIWDREARRAFVARDPYGIKPLYVARIDGGLALASQVKTLLATELVSREPDPVGQSGFWMLGSVPEPHTWYRDIQAVPSGHSVWIAEGKVLSSRCWHDIAAAWHTPKTRRSRGEVFETVRASLRESVERHLVADVPVGVFLSGGIDSGALAGLMVEAGTRDLQGVTITYDEFAGRPDDEAPVAAQIARHYGIRHHVRRVTRDEFLSDLPRILGAMDQPSIDGVNTWYASKAVAELGLKVVVSGVGGDELFFGYRSFRELTSLVKWWSPISAVPGMTRLARGVCVVQARRSGNQRWLHAPRWAKTVSGAWWLRRSLHSPEQLELLMDALPVADVTHEFSPDRWVQEMAGLLPSDPMLALGQIESKTYLRNQLLRDSDWSSMDHSVELRTPLVDSELLRNLAPFIPLFPEFKGKCLLAQAPKRHLPRSIVSRRKTGFGIPLGLWLREKGADPGRSFDAKAWAHRCADAF